MVNVPGAGPDVNCRATLRGIICVAGEAQHHAHRLSWGENNDDMRRKGRGVNPPAMRNRTTFTSDRVSGRNHPQAKITREQLDEMLRLAAAGWTTKQLAVRYCLTIRHVNKLRRPARA